MKKYKIIQALKASKKLSAEKYQPEFFKFADLIRIKLR
jgi:hypothetical protein